MGDFFVRRPIVAIVLSIVMTLIGAVALRRLPVAKFPDIVPPEIQINATYTGADALTVEQSVATPLEQQINGVDNMLCMRSINANDGSLVVFLILAAQYESFRLPFSVLLGTPVAIAGAFIGLLLARLEFNVYDQIGLIMLIGLSAKNAILIVEFAKVCRSTPCAETEPT